MGCQVSELEPTYPCAFCSFDHGTADDLCELCMAVAVPMYRDPANYSPIDLNAMRADNYRTNVMLAVLDHIAELVQSLEARYSG